MKVINYSWVLLFLLAAAYPAHSQQDHELQLGIGGFGLSIPDYLGSDERKSYLVPLPYVYYQTDTLSVDRSGVKSWLWNKSSLYLDVSAAAGLPAKSEDNVAREGMPDLDFTFELGPSLAYYWQGTPQDTEKVYSEVFIRQAFATDLGYIDDIGLKYGFASTIQSEYYWRGHQIVATTKATVNYAQERYLDYYYGVDAIHETPMRAEFTVNSGYSGFGLSQGLTVKRGNIWLGGFVKYASLHQSTQSSSPLVKQKHSWSAGLGLIWIFYNNKGK